MNNISTLKKDLSPYLDARAYPVMLPHVTCVKQKLFLGNRFADRLTKNQSTFLLHCDGSRSFSQVLQQFGIEVPEIIHLTRYLLWWPYPVNDFVNVFEKCDRLVLCSGTELPWLGMGGMLLTGALELKTIILTCFSATSKTGHSLYKGQWDYTLACKDESFFASRVAQTGHVNWNISVNQIQPKDHETDESNFTAFREMIHSFISRTEPSEIFAPAALANDNGAESIREALIELVAEGYITSRVCFYEDSPSCLGYRAIDEFYSSFEDSYLSPTEYYTDISEISGLKAAMLDLFRCRVTNQQKTLWLNSDAKNALVSGNSDWSSAERYWELNFAKFI